MSGDDAIVRVPRWQWIFTPVAVLLTLGWYAGFIAAYAVLAGAQSTSGAAAGILVAEALPLLPPIAGAVLGARIARRRPPVSIVCHAAFGALLALAVVTVLLYGIVAFLAAVFGHSQPGG